MSRTIEFKNNFKSFEKDFESDTRLKVKENMELYIQYVNARISDRTNQMTFHLMNELINIPQQIAFEISNKGR